MTGYLELIKAPFVYISSSGQVWGYREAGCPTALAPSRASADEAQIFIISGFQIIRDDLLPLFHADSPDRNQTRG